MFWEDLKKLLNGPKFYRFDGLIGERLVPVFYALGLGAIGLWAIDHLFASFAFNFGQGLWGILEVLVYGTLWVLALRLACELLLIFFRTHATIADGVNRTRRHNTLLEEVGEAIHDLAEDDDADAGARPVPGTPPGGSSPGSVGTADIDPIIKGTGPRRTAKRIPPAKT